MSSSHIYVDNSNIFIEGSRISAVKRNLVGASSLVDAMNNHVTDVIWNLDYGKLYSVVCGDLNIVSATLWGSPPPGDSFWKMVESNGFSPIVYEKSYGKEKKVDVAIATAITKDFYTGKVKKGDEIVLLSGDKDFVPTLSVIRESGGEIVVAFWDHASSELKAAAASFYNLDPHFDELTKK